MATLFLLTFASEIHIIGLENINSELRKYYLIGPQPVEYCPTPPRLSATLHWCSSLFSGVILMLLGGDSCQDVLYQYHWAPPWSPELSSHWQQLWSPEPGLPCSSHHRPGHISYLNIKEPSVCIMYIEKLTKLFLGAFLNLIYGIVTEKLSKI